MIVGEFITRCFHARTNAHLAHLLTRSYAAHVALGEFYDGLISLVDQFAESYQGEYGLVDGVGGRYTYVKEPMDIVTQLGQWIDDNCERLCDEDDTHLKNILDEIKALITSTQYKLRFLR
jgi:hypothetical protein